jgi:outer membrane lipoprotein-sorting protein
MVPLRSHLAEIMTSLQERLRASHYAIAFCIGVLGLGPVTRAADTNDPLDSWFAAQANIHTWSADFIQTRTLKTLTQPLKAAGRVWFAAPNQFRWELGNPAQTIALRQADQMLVIYPRLQRAERYPMTGAQTGPWKDALILLEAGFPRSRADLEAKFRMSSQSISNEVLTLALEPKSAGARRMIPQLKVAFATNDFTLRATELQFADGSTLRNAFSNPKMNEKIDATLFEPKLPSEYKIVEPLKGP